jgi:hypothetical protein
MAILVEEGLMPNGMDLVVTEPVCRQHTGTVDAVVDGLAVKVLLRLVSKGGELFALRKVVVLRPDGTPLRSVAPGPFIDDVERVRG